MATRQQPISEDSQPERAGETHAESLSEPERGEEKGLRVLTLDPAREITGPTPREKRTITTLLGGLGPGLLAGISGNDSSAVTLYAMDGATVGYRHLWLLLLSTPLYQAIQYACARIGQVTQSELAELLRRVYGPWAAFPAVLTLVITNIALISADLIAIDNGLELLTGWSWPWFALPVALGLWYLLVFHSFASCKKIFLILSLAFVAYLIAAVFSRADWAAVLAFTFLPRVHLDLAGLSSAVALLGATFSPYSMFWQVQAEQEQKRLGTAKQRLRLTTLDVASGTIGGNVIAYAIIICTGSTIFAHHGHMTTAIDAAHSLEPLVGPIAKYLFAIGLIGSGVVAAPVLLASTSSAVNGFLGWSTRRSKQPWQRESFSLILTGALLLSLLLAVLHFDPIGLIFWANVLTGLLAPILIVYVLMLGNSRKAMGDQPLGQLTSLGLALAAFVTLIVTLFFFYGLVFHPGG